MQDSALIVLGGLVCDVNATDLPAGSAARSIDIDYSVGSARTRDGLASVYTFNNEDQQFNAGSGVSVIQAFHPAWTNPSNITHNTVGTYAATHVAGIVSQKLQATTYGFSIPLGATILGVEVDVNGKQTINNGLTQFITSTLACTLGGTTINFGLTTVDGTAALGGIGNLFGLSLTPALVNSAGFGFNIASVTTGTGAETVSISGVVVTIYYAPLGTLNFDYVKSFSMQNGSLLTLAIDGQGTLWQEDVVNNPGVLSAVYTELLPDLFAQSVTYDDREWIALSDLTQGTDMPRQYNGLWVDRVSQVAPGAPPSVTAAASQTYPIISITQPTAQVVTEALLWSSGPGNNSQAGNVITIYYGTHGPSAPDPNVVVGAGVQLAGFSPTPANPGGNYIITSVQTTVGSGGTYNTFCVTAPSSQLFDHIHPGGTYQCTVATLTTSVPLPNIQVGSQIAVAGASVPAWDATWTVTATPNAAQLSVTSTSLTSNVATYDYTLISGVAPVPGQQVTVTGTNNGNGIFNVVDATISSVGVNSFSIALTNANIAPAAETGSAIVNGTIFQFDPGVQYAGQTIVNPIFGNSTGGTVAVPGNLGAGQRQAVVMFQTRNDAITGCSNPVTFNFTEGTNSLVCTNLPIGPPDTTKRIVAFTGAGGAFFFYIPEPVTITNDGGVKTTYTSTVVNDNVSTQATFTFTDAVLLAATSIDTEGSNNFEQIELGSCLGFVAYQNRLFAWGEQNKIQNMINLSFDGGYLPNAGSILVPLGWTVDPVYGSFGQLQVSPVFGDAYYIQHPTGVSPEPFYGMITQTAFQDYLQQPIIQTNTQYGVRVSASNPSGVSGSGELRIDLFSPGFNLIYGSFSILLAAMTTNQAIFTGDLLLSEFFSAVPSDLQYRIYGVNLPEGADILVDRTEPFDLSQPVLTGQLRGSYENNFEAFDDVTGNLGVNVQNQQPVRNAFELFDNLYVVKTASFVETSDNGVTEPDGWTVKEVSNKVGTPSIHGVDVGEGWAIIAGQAGLYIFEGGKPQKISPEIDPLWNTINWKFGETIWVRNDTNNRRILIGVPLPTPNQWMPNFPVNATPSVPNVVLSMTYKELMSAAALQSEGSIRQGYTGQLRTFQFGRRWSVWSIEAAYADFITRGDTTTPVFFCGNQNTAKIYQQLTGNYLDDGAAIPWQYTTYPFLVDEEAQAIHAGLHNLVTTYGAATVIGSGSMNITMIPDTLDTPFADALFPLPLANPPSWGDTEFPLNTVGYRFFVDFQPLEAGDWMELSRIVLTVHANPWAPVTGGGGNY